AKGATKSEKGAYQMKLFQSTHPQMVRQNGIIEGATKKDVNPRTRKGCDNYYARTQPKYIISIHAPAKGATVRDCTVYN
ncbi:hypothetical protein LZU50_02560, partial [Streptococcus agalactiae]|nr:hypothetical protein [Streptococcus agalactiae]